MVYERMDGRFLDISGPLQTLTVPKAVLPQVATEIKSKGQDFLERISALYRLHVEKAHSLSGSDRPGLHEALIELPEKLPRDLPIEELGSSTVARPSDLPPQHPNDEQLSSVLANLPPAVVIENFGLDLLLWTCVKYRWDDNNLTKIKQHLNDLGKDADGLLASKRFFWQLNRTMDYFQVKRLYDARHTLDQGTTGIADLSKYLQKHRNTPEPLSERRLAGYDLKPILLPNNSKMIGWQENWSQKRFSSEQGEKVFGIYMDAPAGLLLLYKGQPQAIVCCYPDPTGRLFINQLQGLQGRVLEDGKYKTNPDGSLFSIGSRGLAVLNYKQLMLHFAASFGRHLGYQEIVLQGGANNIWTRRLYGRDPHLTAEQATTLYDQLAEQLNLVKDNQGNYPSSVSLFDCGF